MKFKHKLISSAVIIVVFIMILSTLIVSLTVQKQNQASANELLKTSFNLIKGELETLQATLMTCSRQMATIDNMGNDVKLAYEFKSESNREIALDTYRKIVKSMFNITTANDLDFAYLYDLDGDLLAFVDPEADQTTAGYPYQEDSEPVYQMCTLAPEEKISYEAWKTVSQPPSEVPLKAGAMADQETAGLEKIGNRICLVSRVPVTAVFFNDLTQQVDQQPIGFITAARKIDSGVVKRLARLTGQDINVFIAEGIIAGTLPQYSSLDVPATAESSSGNWENQQIILSELTLDKTNYFQGILPLYENSAYIGSIAVLRSKAFARANTFQMIKLMVLVSVVCILVVVPLAYGFINAQLRPLSRIISGLNESSDLVSSVSEQLSGASRSLAEGALEQAASIEQASSSLEEISSMSHQNADNANLGNSVMSDIAQIVTLANSSMSELIQAMDDISKFSDQTSKIIKTIDEIAFQTNLLALNAAVEAARAGQFGAGFAVVADEVRNLAMRSAEAARSTSDLIAATTQDIVKGKELVSRTNEAFSQVETSTSRGTELIREIAEASGEQTRGIEQINKAVSEMDKITQNNATNAEETANVSEKLAEQFEQTKCMIIELVDLVGSSASKATGKNYPFRSLRKDLAGITEPPAKKIAQP